MVWNLYSWRGNTEEQIFEVRQFFVEDFKLQIALCTVYKEGAELS